MSLFKKAIHVIKRVYYLITSILLQLFRDLYCRLFHWQLAHREINGSSVSNFIQANSKYWSKITGESSVKEIWVEGHLAEYGPNYLIRSAVVAKALQSVTNYKIRVLYNGYFHQWKVAPSLYRSFGIHDSFFFNSHFRVRYIQFQRRAFAEASKYWAGIKSGSDILNISYKGVLMGDLIYDDIIKHVPHIFTIEKIEEPYFKFIEKAFFYYFQYDFLFKSANVSDFVSTHTAYCEYGLLVRIALKYKVRVYETTDMHLAYFDRIGKDCLPTYHEGFANLVRRKLETYKDQAARDAIMDKNFSQLHDRMAGKIDQVDVALAFRNKVTYTDSLMREKLMISNDNPLVFIICHAFTDSPHISSWQLYNDYYDWLIKTLQIVRDIDNVNWIIKPHPSSALYNEVGVVEQLISDSVHHNIFLTPDDFNQNSLIGCAHAILTVQGTVGIEFSCFGIPVILAGKPFYAGFGFTQEPRTIEEYGQLLKNIRSLEKLNIEQVEKAKLVYGVYNQCLLPPNEIITMEVLENVWGYNKPRDINRAYELVNSSLTTHDCRQMPAYTATLEIASSR